MLVFQFNSIYLPLHSVILTLIIIKFRYIKFYIYVCQIERKKSGEKISGSQRLVLRGHLIVIQNKVFFKIFKVLLFINEAPIDMYIH
jgi:hypothetical protein